MRCYKKMSKEFKIYDLVLRSARLEDLDHFNDVTSVAHFDNGIHNWQLNFHTSPQDFWVLTDPKKEDKMVGVFTGNSVNNDFYYGHQCVILPEYRRKNLFSLIFDTVVTAKGFGANRNQTSIGARMHKPCAFAHKQIGWYGTPCNKAHWAPVSPIPGVDVFIINKDDVPSGLATKVFDYDKALYADFPATNRHHWIRQWIFPEDKNLSRCAVAYHRAKDRVVGFGVTRAQTFFTSMSPVYADSDEIAYLLLRKLGEDIQLQEHVYMEFHANRRSCFKFVREAGLTHTYTNFRTYIPEAPPLPVHKLYCDNEFWPL